MEHDIRNLFNEIDNDKKQLPKHHREEFLEKLERQHQKPRQVRLLSWIKIAAIFVVGIFLYQWFSIDEEPALQELSIQTAVKELEKEYLPAIAKEWDTFLKVSKDTLLINRYKKRLKDSKQEYKDLSDLIKEHPDDVKLLQSLINNLQNRLLIINEINNHIKQLNQKNKSNETIYL